MTHLLFGPRPWSYGQAFMAGRRGAPTWHDQAPRAQNPKGVRVLVFCGLRNGGEVRAFDGWDVTKNPGETTCPRCLVELDVLLERGLAKAIKARSGGALVVLKMGKLSDGAILQVAISGASSLRGMPPALPPAHGPSDGGGAAQEG